MLFSSNENIHFEKFDTNWHALICKEDCDVHAAECLFVVRTSKSIFSLIHLSKLNKSKYQAF